MTREEFIAFYCAGTGITWEQLSKYRDAVPCDCGEGGCQGWQMRHKELIDGVSSMRKIKWLEGIGDHSRRH